MGKILLKAGCVNRLLVRVKVKCSFTRAMDKRRNKPLALRGGRMNERTTLSTEAPVIPL